MDTKRNAFFWKILEHFNFLMKESIEGPDCTDPNKCHGDCCSIKIDVPRVLAEWYIQEGLAKETDFIRSDIFSFHLRFNEKTGKCFFFDKKINGCRVHNTRRKPPQCWIYPTGFSNSSNINISCKKLGGWKINNPTKAIEAEILLKTYVFLCQVEAVKERKLIRERIRNSFCLENHEYNLVLHSSLVGIPPSRLGGFRDSWDEIKYLSAEGYSLQMKKFCKKYNPQCELLQTKFLKCNNICNIIATKLIEYLDCHIVDYINKNGYEVEGEYPLFKLFNQSGL